MNKLPFHLAWHYTMSSQYEKNISTMIKVCFIGIMIGSFALALVMAIMSGFEQAVYEKMQGIHAQIIMKSPANEPLDYARIKEIFSKEFPAIQASSPSSFGNVILQTSANNDISNALLLHAIDPQQEQQTTTIGTKIIEPQGSSLAQCIQDDGILIGSSLASALGLRVGDSVSLLFKSSQPTSSRRINFDNKSAKISAIFKTGVDEIDSIMLFCAHDFFDQLFPETGITQINIRLHPGSTEKALITQLKDRFDLDVFTWKDLYLPLMSALKLETYAMFFILALILLVASMSIVSLLFMQITQKRGDIAILKAMGMADKQIRSVFVLMGFGIAVSAAAIGLASAWLVGMLLRNYLLISLPDVYYSTYLPVNLDPTIFATIFMLVVIMTLCATLLPLRNIKNINLSSLLRFEA